MNCGPFLSLKSLELKALDSWMKLKREYPTPPAPFCSLCSWGLGGPFVALQSLDNAKVISTSSSILRYQLRLYCLGTTMEPKPNCKNVVSSHLTLFLGIFPRVIHPGGTLSGPGVNSGLGQSVSSLPILSPLSGMFSYV